jgi:hypothetical protein
MPCPAYLKMHKAIRCFAVKGSSGHDDFLHIDTNKKPFHYERVLPK